MSPISDQRDRQTASNRYSQCDRHLKKLSMSDYASNTADNIQPLCSVSHPPQVHQLIPRQRSRLMSFKAKVVALAIAISTLPVMATTADSFTNRSLIEPRSQVQQAPTLELAQNNSKSRQKLALTLAIETVVAALLLVGLVAAFMANRAMRPLVTTAAKDDKSAKKEPNYSSMQLTNQLAYQPSPVNSLSLSEQQEDLPDHSQLLTEISLRIRQSQYSGELLRTTVKEVRRAIKTDRVVIYGLDPSNWDGNVLAESVEPGWPQTLMVKIDDPCFRDRHVELYKQGQVTHIDDIYQDPRVTDCYRRMLEQFAVRANLVAPILKNNELVGLMIAHQCSEPRYWQQPDINLFTQIATQVGFAMAQVSFLEEQEAAAERGQLFTEISSRIRQCVYLDDLLKTTVKEVRRALKADRVIIYGLDPISWDGIVLAESVSPGWPQILRVRIDDPCLRERYVEMYLNGRIRAINDISKEPGLTDCYIKMVEQFAVKAQLVAPIVKNNELLGLLIAHQCAEPRVWQKLDIDLFGQLATQVGFAVHQVSLLEQIEQ